MFIMLVLIVGQELYSQNNVLVEYKYLQLVNDQGDQVLAADNYRNAEIICDSIISNSYVGEINSKLFFELANSYQLNKEYGMMAFSILRQRCFAPNDSFNVEGQRLFEEAALRLQLTHKQAKDLFNATGEEPVTKDNYAIKMELLYQGSIFLFDAKVDNKLMRYFSFYNTQKLHIGFMHQQWQFLTMIDLGMKKKKRILSNRKLGTANIDYWQIENNKLHKRVLMRAAHYYRKSGANAEAVFFLDEYKKLDLNVFNKIQRKWRLMIIPN